MFSEKVTPAYFFFCGKPVDLQVDDGGGMDPEAIRRCMSFGFSDKKSKSAIGRCNDLMSTLLFYSSQAAFFHIYFLTCVF